MGSFFKLTYHIIFATRYRRKTKLNLFANTFRIKRSTIESNRLKRSTSSFCNATGLNSSDDICSRARAADCCRRFAAWRDWVGYPIPWAHPRLHAVAASRLIVTRISMPALYCCRNRHGHRLFQFSFGVTLKLIQRQLFGTIVQDFVFKQSLRLSLLSVAQSSAPN